MMDKGKQRKAVMASQGGGSRIFGMRKRKRISMREEGERRDGKASEGGKKNSNKMNSKNKKKDKEQEQRNIKK